MVNEWRKYSLNLLSTQPNSKQILKSYKRQRETVYTDIGDEISSGNANPTTLFCSIWRHLKYYWLHWKAPVKYKPGFNTQICYDVCCDINAILKQTNKPKFDHFLPFQKKCLNLRSYMFHEKSTLKLQIMSQIETDKYRKHTQFDQFLQ